MNKKMWFVFLVIIIVVAFVFMFFYLPKGCTQEAKICQDGTGVSRNPNLNCNFDPCPIPATIKMLYSQNKNSGIDECMYNEEKTYSFSLNAYDAGNNFYNEQGELIGNCNYFANMVDSICEDAQDCVNVYMVENNIWGKPAVDEYG